MASSVSGLAPNTRKFQAETGFLAALEPMTSEYAGFPRAGHGPAILPLQEVGQNRVLVGRPWHAFRRLDRNLRSPFQPVLFRFGNQGELGSLVCGGGKGLG